MGKRSELVTARMTAQERRRVELAAELRRESRSSYVRKVADRAAREDLGRLLEERAENLTRGEDDGE